MNLTTETRDRAKALLRSVPEIAIDRDWVKESLLDGEGEFTYFVDVEEHHVYRNPNVRTSNGQTVRLTGEKEIVGCSTVTGCCAMGYVELTAVCANGYTGRQVNAALEMLEDALIELGWAEPVFRAHYDQMAEDDYYGTHLSFEDWREEISEERAYETIGEGLIPEWNDHFCESKEQVLELVAKAAA